MIDFIKTNISTIIISVIMLCIVTFIIYRMIKAKKAGKSCSCGCGCSGCPQAGSCHKES